jgi:hypothetical protein
MLAAATGIGAALFDAPLFSTAFDYFHLPLIGEFELATALLFDLGVAVTVFGAVMLALAELSHVAQRAEKTAEETRRWTSIRAASRRRRHEPRVPRRSSVAILTAAGIFLCLARPHLPGRARPGDAVLRDQRVPVRDGPAGGRPAADLRQGVAEYTDPLPQALVLTAIVIAFGMTALVVVLALRTYLETGTDHVDGTDRSGR